MKWPFIGTDSGKFVHIEGMRTGVAGNASFAQSLNGFGRTHHSHRYRDARRRLP